MFLKPFRGSVVILWLCLKEVTVKFGSA